MIIAIIALFAVALLLGWTATRPVDYAQSRDERLRRARAFERNGGNGGYWE